VSSEATPPEQPIVVVSPHLDDGVLSCGGLLAARPRSTVVTVFAGRPPNSGAVTQWDAASGFSEFDGVIDSRRLEDAAACATVGATPVWLPFLDAQYSSHTAPVVAAIATSIGRVLDTGCTALAAIPLGLFHEDHRVASEAALAACRAHPSVRTVFYADWPYARHDELVTARLRCLRQRGLSLQTAIESGRRASQDICSKRRAIDCYQSQLRAFSTSGLRDPRQGIERELLWEARCV